MDDDVIDRLFKGFRTAWGAQKMAAVFPPSDMEAVCSVWEMQLAGMSIGTIERAAQAVIDAGSPWPPTLPEFKAVCRQYMQQSPAKRLNAPAGSDAVAQAAIRKAQQMVRADSDPLGLKDEEIAFGVIGKVQRIYLEHVARGAKPNKRWACRLVLSFAGGEDMRALQAMMACEALGLSQDEIDELSEIRRGLTQGAR